MIGIYKITNPKEKIYVGKSKNIEKRFKDYKNIQGCKQQRKLYYSFKKYGIENHKFEIIEECTVEQLNEREIYWINKLDCIKEGLNLTKGGDGGELSKESQEIKRIKLLKPILQYDLEGNFIREYLGATEAIKHLGKGKGNNINDCARGKYKSTYGYQWVYKKDNYSLKIEKVNIKRGNFNSWNEEQKNKYKESRKGEKRSLEYSKKIQKLKIKTVYQYNIDGDIVNEYPSFKSFNGSKIIGTKKLRQIINKNIFYKGFKYSYEKIN